MDRLKEMRAGLARKKMRKDQSLLSSACTSAADISERPTSNTTTNSSISALAPVVRVLTPAAAAPVANISPPPQPTPVSSVKPLPERRPKERRPLQQHVTPMQPQPQVEPKKHAPQPLRNMGRLQPSSNAGLQEHRAEPQVYTTPSVVPSTQRVESVLVNGRAFAILSVLGRGGCGCVYEVYDTSKKLRGTYALKQVNLEAEQETIRTSYLNEVKLLEMLKSSHEIIHLFDYEVKLDENNEPRELCMLLEKGDADLATTIGNRITENGHLDPLWIQYHWGEMLRAVRVIHSHQVIHSDLKPANFLIVKGSLKLIDFGIASTVDKDKTSVHKASAIGTVNYMSPESLSPGGDCEHMYKLNPKTDVWSLGCILYTMVYGVPPFHAYKNYLQKVNAICNPRVSIEFPPIVPVDNAQLRDVMRRCLERDVDKRASVEELLAHPYLAAVGSSAQSSLGRSTSTPALDSSISDNGGMLEELAIELAGKTPRTLARRLRELCLDRKTS